eukprot:TRINITY_DN7586_c1_g2_i1.p1 TRINITY_DN7586_c1_g2~~TRINITY_DN7586_c1_g2_i1.p1  ORF type:complete len:486 (+),score=95.06 TRINITY_DN7586_c1_g2_i1:44-1459(+)
MSLTNELRQAGRLAATECCEFLNASPTPYHCVEYCKSQLVKKGYSQLMENASWEGQVKQNGKYFVTRNQSSLIAFTVGGQFQGGNGFKIVGAHTDSPCFLVKPKSAQSSVGYKEVGIQTYGGGLWHTWFDRDLSIAGRVVVQKEGKLATKLIRIAKPILRIPNLAIHLTDRGEGFNYNKEQHLLPMMSSEIMSKLVNPEEPKKEGEKDKESPKHHPEMLKLIAGELGCEVAEISDFDLYLYDTQDAVVGGIHDEFIFGARLDNLLSCYNCLKGMGDMTTQEIAADNMISMFSIYDHEEVGSASAVGAGSSMTSDIIRRLTSCFTSSSDAFERAIRSSFVMSVDGVHGVHPNYSEKHQMNHRPLMHKGPTIKYNANQRYATTSVGSGIVKMCASHVGIPIQEVCVKNDSPCGSTIGPIISTGTGIHTLDIGVPMLSMHSVREQCGTVDLHYMNKLIHSFFVNFATFQTAELA